LGTPLRSFASVRMKLNMIDLPSLGFQEPAPPGSGPRRLWADDGLAGAVQLRDESEGPKLRHRQLEQPATPLQSESKEEGERDDEPGRRRA
jgi:hypothetical protein